MKFFNKKIFNKRVILSLVVLNAMLLAFMNCGDLKSRESILLRSSSLDGDIPAWVDMNDCLNNSTVDACLFFKNPVVTKKSVFPSELTYSTDLETYQTMGVLIEDLNGLDYLQSSSFILSSSQGKKVEINTNDNNELKVSFNEYPSRLSQISAYFWATTAKNIMLRRTGLFYAVDKAIKIVTDHDFSGWSPGENTIYLETTQTGNSAALDASLVIHLLAEANLYYATQGGSHDIENTNTHVDCGVSDGPVYKDNCCASKLGCASAIISGVSDYMVATLFPNYPAIGELYSNSLNGISHCGVSRSPNVMKSFTAQESYESCKDSNANGQVHVMGVFYASLWFEMRELAGVEFGSQGVSDIDTLYMRHLSAITASDTFKEALNKAKDFDQNLFLGKYETLFDNQLRRFDP